MAFYTPNGLKIRIAPETAFTYMERLRGKYRPAEILNMVEGLEMISTYITLMTALTCFVLQFEPSSIFITITAANIIANFIVDETTWFAKPQFLIRLNRLQGVTLIYIVLAAIGFALVGWKGTIYAALAIFISGCISYIFDHLRSKAAYKEFGFILTKSERLFFKVIAVCGKKAGVSTNPVISEEEKQSSGWSADYMLYTYHYPEPSK